MHIERAAFAAARYTLSQSQIGVENFARGLWPDDRVTPSLVARGAVSPTSPASASSLAPQIVADFMQALVPQSAGAKLIAAALRLSLAGVNSATIPHRSGLPDPNLVWVAPGAPFPFKQYTLAATVLGPTCKLVLGVTLTRELVEHANGQDIIGTLLREDAAMSLDASLFSTATASATRPAGLLNGLSALTGTAGGGAAAFAADLKALGGDLARAGSSADIVFIMAPEQALSASLMPATINPPTIWSSLTLVPGSVIAIEPRAFMSAFGTDPRILASTEATVHMEDTTALAIGTAGTPNTVAAPVTSLFQTDLVAIKMLLDAAWTMRASGMVAYLTGATW
jgi:hypothetical protein